MGLTALSSIIYESHCTISANFYLYLQYFQQNKWILNIIELRMKFLTDQNMMFLEYTDTIKDIVRSLGNCLSLFSFFFFFFKLLKNK